MEAAPLTVGVATASPMPPPERPEATQWVSPPGNLSVRLTSDPAPVWSRSAQSAMALLLVLAIALIGWHTYGAHRWSCRPAALESDAGDPPGIDLNQADHAQLLQLPGVGNNLAQRIEAYRAEHHGFRDVDELRQVSGVGPKQLEKLRSFVYVTPREGNKGSVPARRPTAEVKEETEPRSASKKKTASTQPININRADATELQRLPGVGPKLSQRIIETREKKPFQSVNDLRRVPGIGVKTLERLRPLIVVP